MRPFRLGTQVRPQGQKDWGWSYVCPLGGLPLRGFKRTETPSLKRNALERLETKNDARGCSDRHPDHYAKRIKTTDIHLEFE